MARRQSRAHDATVPSEPAEGTTEQDVVAEYSLVVRWSDAEKSFLAEVPDWPGVRAFGPTRQAALQRAEHMLRLAIDTHRDQGWEPPLPAPAAEGTGQFRLRLPRQLHAQLAVLAARNGVSLNQFVVSLLAEGVGRTAEIARAKPSIEFAARVVLERELPNAVAALAEAVRQAIQVSLGQSSAGVPVAERMAFFDSPSEYMTVKPHSGAGLGLAVAKQIIYRYTNPGAPAAGAEAGSGGITDPGGLAGAVGGGEER
jgi:antitoxin HicB